jgi:LPS-assembly lipoprotein
MWWPEKRSAWRQPSRLRAAGVITALAIGLPVLAGCSGNGFQPLYGQSGVGAGMQQRMAAVEFQKIPGRVGQRMRNELIFLSTGGGHPAPPEYRVETVIKQQVKTTLVKIDGDSRAQVYVLEAAFRIIDLKSKKVLLQGSSTSQAVFERFNPIFSNIRAREDAENRAARTVAREVHDRIAAFLSRSS